MSDGAYVAAAAAAAAAHAIKASGAIVSVNPQDFLSILHKTERPLVVTAEEKFLRAVYKYLTSYRGLVFFTKTKEQLHLPSDVELVISKKIWIPS